MALMLISAFAQESVCVLLQDVVPSETNEKTVNPGLRRQMVVTGRLIPAVAGHRYPETREQIVESGSSA